MVSEVFMVVRQDMLRLLVRPSPAARPLRLSRCPWASASKTTLAATAGAQGESRNTSAPTALPHHRYSSKKSRHWPHRLASAPFHATAKTQSLPLIGLGIFVLATAASYMIRASQRLQKSEGGGPSPDDEDESDSSSASSGVGKAFPVMGLDLGTLQACVAVSPSKATAPAVVVNSEGRRSTPSFLTYQDDHVVVGQLARRNRWRTPQRVAYNTQRLLGLPYDDKLRSSYPFRLEKGEDGGIMVDLGVHQLTAADAASRIYESLASTAEDKLHQPPGFAVVAVPSYFTPEQRKATVKAAQAGTGLESVDVMDEAVAALVGALAVGALGPEPSFAKPWAVIDMGALSCQLSLVEVSSEQGFYVKDHRVLWTAGGELFDMALVRHLVEGFKKSNKGIDLSMDYMAMERLHEAAEATKIELSTSLSSTVSLPFITADHTGPKHLNASFSRSQYSALIDPFLHHLDQPFKDLLSQPGVQGPGGLEGVVVTGGCARLAVVRDHVSRLAGGRAVVSLEQPEEAVAMGACFYAKECMD